MGESQVREWVLSRVDWFVESEVFEMEAIPGWLLEMGESQVREWVLGRVDWFVESEFFEMEAVPENCQRQKQDMHRR